MLTDYFCRSSLLNLLVFHDTVRTRMEYDRRVHRRTSFVSVEGVNDANILAGV